MYLILAFAIFGLAFWGAYINVIRKKYCGVIFQALETVYILDTTVKFNVFSSRFRFLQKIAPTLIDGSLKSSYDKWVSSSCELYKTKYSDRSITEHQKQVLENPERIITSDFKGQQYASWYKMYCDAKESEIASLKTEKAKQRRRDEALEAAKYLLGDMLSKECYQYHPQITKELLRFDINLNIDYGNKN